MERPTLKLFAEWTGAFRPRGSTWIWNILSAPRSGRLNVMKTSAVLKTSTPSHGTYLNMHTHIFLSLSLAILRRSPSLLPSLPSTPSETQAPAWVSLCNHVFSARHASRLDCAGVISHCCQNISVRVTFPIVPVLLLPPPSLPPPSHLALQQTMAALVGTKRHTGGENNSQRGGETEII